ncbi:MAG TPA: hypothetical protein VMW75_19445, partial [Thermoanaerobaculia bacterium]|nr:hypothetical protein [Thermoanaerobaculia bacterium]
DLPLEMVVHEVAPDRSLSHPPLLQLSLNFLHHDLGGVAAVGDLTQAAARSGRLDLELEEFDFDYANASAELGLVVAYDGKTMKGSLHYRTQLFEPSTIDAIVEQFEYLLGLVAGDPGLRLGALEDALAGWDERRTAVERERLKLTSLERLQHRRRRAFALGHSANRRTEVLDHGKHASE